MKFFILHPLFYHNDMNNTIQMAELWVSQKAKHPANMVLGWVISNQFAPIIAHRALKGYCQIMIKTLYYRISNLIPFIQNVYIPHKIVHGYFMLRPSSSTNGIFRLSVCLSVCPSVCLYVTPFWLCSHHRIIMKFSGVITNDQSKVHAKGQGHRSKVKVTEVTTQLNRFRTVPPVWIHISWWNDAYGLMLLRGGALLFFSRSSVKFQGHTA